MTRENSALVYIHRTLDDNGMLKTQRLIVACLVLAFGVGIGLILSTVLTVETVSAPSLESVDYTMKTKETELYTALVRTIEEKGAVTGGLSPYTLLEHFSSIEEADFMGVEAVVGRYEFSDGVLTYQSGEMVDTAAAADISEAGFSLFLKNYSSRTGFDFKTGTTEDAVKQFGFVTESDGENVATSSPDFVACTMDAKLCPDGSYVGRSGPDCAFDACADEATQPVTIDCTVEQKKAEACIEIYQPVCASVQIQCITTPCEPILKTFGNSCQACSEHSVTEYSEGACATE